MDAKLWADMFHLTLPVSEKILRSVIIYAFLVLGLRLAGKRELAQLNALDLVVLLTLSNTVQNAIIGDDNSVTGGIIGAATLLFVNYVVVRFLFQHPGLDELVEGGPDMLIAGGMLQHENLRRELITVTELETAAHKQGFSTLTEIDSAVLEPGGTISFVGKKPTAETQRHHELLARLDSLTQELRALARPSAG